MSTTHPPGQEPPLELQEIERTEGTMMDDLDLPEERRGLRAWLPWIAGVVIFVATIAVLYGLEGGINHFVNGFRAKERAAEQGRIVYEAGSKDVVPNVVFIDSHPPGAIVRVNGQKLGRTPAHRPAQARRETRCGCSSTPTGARAGSRRYRWSTAGSTWRRGSSVSGSRLGGRRRRRGRLLGGADEVAEHHQGRGRLLRGRGLVLDHPAGVAGEERREGLAGLARG